MFKMLAVLCAILYTFMVFGVGQNPLTDMLMDGIAGYQVGAWLVKIWFFGKE